MKRIAIVVQRYGLEVNGGSELYCRQIAERLVKFYEVEVLTTCAIDYVTWRNEYSQGAEVMNRVTVRRFKTDRERVPSDFDRSSRKIFSSKSMFSEGLAWQQEQGPVSTDLLHYLEEHKGSYYVVIFMTYLYATTYFGLHIAPERSILIPTAHDEPPIHLNIFNSLFHLPRVILFLTEEEKKFVQTKFKNSYISSLTVGLGVECPSKKILPNFRKKYGIADRFVLYVGRIDESKGCGQLFDFFLRYVNEGNRKGLKLVLIGKPVFKIPKDPRIISLGFLSDEDKFAAIESADLIVNPSQYESLSMILLEAFSMDTPVLVNGNCEVLKGHCLRSNGGLFYENYVEFCETLDYLLDHDRIRLGMGQNGRQYVERNYQWAVIEDKFRSAIEVVGSSENKRLCRTDREEVGNDGLEREAAL
ncbi:glycosyltransferase family 4 protein [Desulfosporosinus metallidurans]|uniref:Putative glycosyl transferase n=1 Tax=Desulfosporosinus metallidurans TaxID=1888891 RepID=A0A1Q8QXV5_9FIRM|nr:glycosyltransferase family 4 protein [Desulfosporosinus metallidurans]OLN32161.1 putative glycosyl transferase [Desulfosporosinus metallidurans]